MSTRSGLKLLIREIDPSTHNGRYLRENLRRIQDFLDGVASGSNTFITFENIGGTSTVFNKVDNFVTSFDGETNFTLSSTPADPTKVVANVNGVYLTNGVHFTVSGTTFTFNSAAAGYSLEVSNEFGQPDRLQVQYLI